MWNTGVYVLGGGLPEFMAGKWNTGNGGSHLIQSGGGRFGDSWRFTASGTQYLVKILDQQATWTAGFAIKNNSWTTGMRFFGFADNNPTFQMEIGCDSAGHLRLTRNNTVLATGTTVLSNGVFYYIEFKVTINSSTGAYELRINGNTELSASGTNTQATGNAWADRFYLGDFSVGGGETCDVCDLYVLDGTGSVNNTFLGDCRVDALFPSGAGNYTQLTPSAGSNYAAVDEKAQNGDTDYVESGTVSQKDSYAYGDLATSTGSVFGVQLVPFARKTDAGTRSIKGLARLSSTDVLDSTDKTLSSSYAYYPDVRETKPGGGSWAISDVNSAEFGVQVTA